MAEFLLEIGIEDLPIEHIKIAKSQLRENFENFLRKKRIGFSKIVVHGTLRRLLIYVENISLKQDDEEIRILGPAKKLAFLEDGTPLEPAMGFAKFHGIESSQLEFFETPKGIYCGFVKKIEGRKTREILEESLMDVTLEIDFPKTLRWEDSSIRFSRPIRSIVSILDNDTLNLKMSEINSSDYTFGHRIWGRKQIKVENFKDYLNKLEKNFVIVDEQKRKEIIIKKIKEIENELNAKVIEDSELLENWVYLVEYPFVFYGRFDDEYLNLPFEIIRTTLRESQKCFSMKDLSGNSLPYFIGIADSPGDPKNFIKKGNERIIKAKLDDAGFFWKEDRSIPFASRLKDLKSIIYQEKLGNYLDKTERLEELAIYLREKISYKEDLEALGTASRFSKIDLLTDMVKEFPSLQGVMGGLYLREEGYEEKIWKAIYEHYKPLNFEDSSPSTMEGAVLSLADKIDLLAGIFSLNLLPSGSKDPFGLRRAGFGICKIIIDHKLTISIIETLEKALNLHEKNVEFERYIVIKNLIEFLKTRLNYIFEEIYGYRYDIINASIKSGIDNIYFSYLRAKSLSEIQEDTKFNKICISFRRIKNIIDGMPHFTFDEKNLIEKEEKYLYQIFSSIKEEIIPYINKGNFKDSLETILNLEPIINKFFDKVLVMTEDQKLRENRLALLQNIHQIFMEICDFSEIVISENSSNQTIS
ncbi:MAG: glycine--tRNA ligase subunit beta [Acidobacteriota bacterium]